MIPVIFAQVETSEIHSPMDRYDSSKTLVSVCIRSTVFILNPTES